MEEIKDQPQKTENIADKKKNWYVLSTMTGYENVAKQNLELVIEKYGLQDRIFDIVIPMEDVVEEKNGKQKVVSRKGMPGYIFVKMIYGDDIWHAVAKYTRGIKSFAGPKGRPLPLTDEEVHKMRLEKVTVVDVNLEKDDKVEILEGALNGFVGNVVSVDVPNQKVKINVEMFGRETPVELQLGQVRKIN